MDMTAASIILRERHASTQGKEEDVWNGIHPTVN
jgi:hypothetical protein